MTKTLLEARFHDDCFRKIMTLTGGKMSIKPEYASKIKWFSDSPDGGLVCSLCNKKISDDDCPIRFWREARP